MGRKQRREVVSNTPVLPLDVITLVARCGLGAAAVLCRVCGAYYKAVRPVIASSFYSPISEYEVRRHLRRELDRYSREERTDDGRRSTFYPPVIYKFVTMSQRMCSYHVIQLEEANMKSNELITVSHIIWYSAMSRDEASITSKCKRVQVENVLFSRAVDIIMGLIGSARGDIVLPHVSRLEVMLDHRYGPDRRFYLGEYIHRVVGRLMVTPMMERVLDISDGHHGRVVEAMLMTPHTDSELLRTCLRVGILGVWCSGVDDTNTTWFIWPEGYASPPVVVTTGSARVRISILAGTNALITATNLVRNPNPL